MNIRTVLFDLDGTLFDTQIFHAETEVELIRPHGIVITAEELTAKYAGRPTEEVFMEVIGCSREIADILYRKKWQKIMSRAAEARPLCDIPNLLLELEKKGCQFGIGTASPTEWAWALINAHLPARFFNPFNVIGGDMVTKGKPDPEIWVRLAKDVNKEVERHNCLVVEDGLAGTVGALEAGMNCALLLPRTHPYASQISNAADILQII